ncbi:hypothetical protein BJY52DRAFT_358061 [Lactarius psammicola]|nr:hypothetical protein BJY52DRAFT_358061 [Lactarius psammicola]
MSQPTQKSSFFDFLKPRYHEAVFRLKNSVIAVIALATLTHLLPIPTPYASAWKFYRDTFQSPWEKGVAIAELAVFGILLANILQASVAIRSPPAPHPPIPSPAKALSPPRQSTTTTTPNWRSLGLGSKNGGLSPNTTPQRQLPFSASTSVGGPSTGAGSASDPRGLAQSYSLAFSNFLASPSSLSPSSSPAAHDRSFGSLPPSPSPVSPLAAYRGRRAPTGRGLDGSLLARLAQGDSDSDADE